MDFNWIVTPGNQAVPRLGLSVKFCSWLVKDNEKLMKLFLIIILCPIGTGQSMEPPKKVVKRLYMLNRLRFIDGGHLQASMTKDGFIGPHAPLSLI